jgi:hypothetical protein
MIQRQIFFTSSLLYSFEILCTNIFLYRHNVSFLTREQASRELSKVEAQLKSRRKWQKVRDA